MYWLALALLVFGLLVLVLLLIEVRQYRTGRHLISRRRFALRIAAGVLMLLLLAAVFVGLFLLGLRDAYARPQFFIAYWAGCIVIAVALAWVMLSDMQEVEDRFSHRQHQLWREMARFVAEDVKREKADRSGGEGNEEE